MTFPLEFQNKMYRLLGAEYEEFEASYTKLRRRGLRVNTSKIKPEAFEKIAPFPIERIPWVDNGYFYTDNVRPARHPYYAAGLYYLQEPSAMTPASRLPLEAGDNVLDLCAAPGGKATELAARLDVLDRRSEKQEDACADGHQERESGREPGQKGFLVANDISRQRARALLHNLEMTGTDNYCVLNETPERLAEMFPNYFDKILVDAPCSGEGMFRKEEEALRLWSPQRVEDFADQQRAILIKAYEMLKPGGVLLYSTCTFSPEENEQQIAFFLTEHPDMSLQEIEPWEGFAPGRPEWCFKTDTGSVPDPLNIRRCVRIWPHRMDGEGHFLALMKKEAGPGELDDTGCAGGKARYGSGHDGKEYRTKDCAGRKGKGKRTYGEGRSGKGKGSDTAMRPDRDQLLLIKEFLCDMAGDTRIAEDICTCMEIRQEKVFLPGAVPAEKLKGLHVMRGGMYLGDLKKNRFEPSQSWAMTLHPGILNIEKQKVKPSFSGSCVRRVFCLGGEDPRLKRFLGGESIAGTDLPDGWTLVCVRTSPDDSTPECSGDCPNSRISEHDSVYPVGWAKVVRGTVKNHYPISWRITG